ncbi:predicted protein [Nematostella vectensis]|uniref:Arrestin C-terminal-like domain-containing protein n=1 Tax=Nematostella vectensis TaxID=45351 RepID=A7SL06_NEMVE|nr:arrestin domain-containing protein 3 [Nematostella vectensis]EDO35609.1 predicted protein [Nematostella vectensis]|eukprot:XP_001627709.1 predicted protein [Nematostella vectensis]
MTIENYAIELDRKDLVYTLGDYVSGEVRFTLTKEIRVREIYLHFFGRGKVEVMEGRTTFIGKQEYYRHVAELLDKEKVAGMNGILKPGEYKYPFSFELPFDGDLPGTYEAKHGYIKYSLEALIDRPLMTPAKTGTLITVIDYVEIDKTLLEPRQKQENWHVGYNCCASGSLTVTAKIDRAGFYIGDEAQVTVFLDNQSTRDVTDVEICLFQFTTYIYGTDENEYQVKDRLIDSVKREGVARGKEVIIDDVTITIPQLRPTSLYGIITTAYTIEVIINIKGRCVESAHIPLPIIIGSIKTPKGEKLPLIQEITYGRQKDSQESTETNIENANKDIAVEQGMEGCKKKIMEKDIVVSACALGNTGKSEITVEVKRSIPVKASTKKEGKGKAEKKNTKQTVEENIAKEESLVKVDNVSKDGDSRANPEDL